MGVSFSPLRARKQALSDFDFSPPPAFGGGAGGGGRQAPGWSHSRSKVNAHGLLPWARTASPSRRNWSGCSSRWRNGTRSLSGPPRPWTPPSTLATEAGYTVCWAMLISTWGMRSKDGRTISRRCARTLPEGRQWGIQNENCRLRLEFMEGPPVELDAAMGRVTEVSAGAAAGGSRRTSRPGGRKQRRR
jgi:hypothetical protein